MNIVETIIAKRTQELLIELEQLTTDIIAESQRKANSTALHDLMSQGDLDPALQKQMGKIHLQLSLLRNMVGTVSDG